MELGILQKKKRKKNLIILLGILIILILFLLSLNSFIERSEGFLRPFFATPPKLNVDFETLQDDKVKKLELFNPITPFFDVAGRDNPFFYRERVIIEEEI